MHQQSSMCGCMHAQPISIGFKVRVLIISSNTSVHMLRCAKLCMYKLLGVCSLGTSTRCLGLLSCQPLAPVEEAETNVVARGLFPSFLVQSRAKATAGKTLSIS